MAALKTDIIPEDMNDMGNEPALSVDSLTGELHGLRQTIGEDPQLNPTALLAYKLSRRFENGDVALEDFATCCKTLTDRAFARRAWHIHEYLGMTGDADGRAKCAELVEDWARASGDGFDEFQDRLHRPRVGAVLTAHPTFGMSSETSIIMANLTEAESEDAALEMSKDQLRGVDHGLEGGITLREEHQRAQQAAVRMKDALAWINRALIGHARETWPDRWRELVPEPMTVASWVGYDLDGRTDIGWQQMVALKLEEKVAQLERYSVIISALRTRGDSEDITDKLWALDALLGGAIAHTRRCHQAFSGALDDIDDVATAANALSDTSAQGRMVDCNDLIVQLDDAIAATASDEIAADLMALRAEVCSIGLGTAHIHLRINSRQLQNGIDQLIKLGESDAGAGRLQTSRLNKMIAEADTRQVNFRSLMQEQSTAIRQFILMAQILKHIDSVTPIRFLIAECEQPFTVLTALYFARLFGVDDRVDISPLFETPAALERGARILEQLIENERYLAYVRLRGRMAIQTGFSDAGRFLGQIPATLAIERLQIKLARMLGGRGVEDIEVVIFDTHGESMGRGAHPESLADRLLYVLSPLARRQFQRAGIPVKHETSFQGGDGYLLFANDHLARHALLAVLKDSLTIDALPDRMDGAPPHDGLYDDTDFALDFFLHLKTYHEHLFESPDYRIALAALGTNMLFKTGSRKSVRQHEAASLVDRGNPAQMRAIPHNAILQQLGYLANVVSGVGSAVGDEVERFVALSENSDRARRLFSMVAYAKRISSLNTLGAYARVFDSGYWVSRAYAGGEPTLARPLRNLAERLSGDPRHEGMMRLVHELRQDAIDLHIVLERLDLDGGKAPRHARLELDLLHAIRIALMEHIFLLAARIPPFATRNDVSPERVMSLILDLEVPTACSILREVFPRTSSEQGDAMFVEDATYSADLTGGYQDLHDKLIEPMQAAYDLLRKIGIGISHHFLAHG